MNTNKWEFCRKSITFWAQSLCLFALLGLALLLSAQKVHERKKASSVLDDFEISYDLRDCEMGFEVLWRYYQVLGSQEGAKILADAQQLRRGTLAAGRFPSRQAVPQLERFAKHLGSSKQNFALLLWRDKGRDRAYTFAVQRNLDVYGKPYYPFMVYENLKFPWQLWHRQNPSIGCDESRLFQDIPGNSSLSLGP